VLSKAGAPREAEDRDRESRRTHVELNVDTMLTKAFDVSELRQVVDTLEKSDVRIKN
jgi:hypothetical protein